MRSAEDIQIFQNVLSQRRTGIISIGTGKEVEIVRVSRQHATKREDLVVIHVDGKPNENRLKSTHPGALGLQETPTLALVNTLALVKRT